MSKALYNTGGLRFWNQEQIMLRKQSSEQIVATVRNALMNINPAWRFEQCEGPVITPSNYISSAYTEDDIWVLKSKIGEQDAALRAETTASSYLYAEHLLNNGYRMPLCVWQEGRSYRREILDGASASRLRFNEFWQLELQCIYSPTTKADYRTAVTDALLPLAKRLCHTQSRLVDSDRLPSYSEITQDVEVEWERNGVMEWKEIASISTRTDYPNAKVLEIAFGLDRIVTIAEKA